MRRGSLRNGAIARRWSPKTTSTLSSPSSESASPVALLVEGSSSLDSSCSSFFSTIMKSMIVSTFVR